MKKLLKLVLKLLKLVPTLPLLVQTLPLKAQLLLVTLLQKLARMPLVRLAMLLPRLVKLPTRLATLLPRLVKPLAQ